MVSEDSSGCFLGFWEIHPSVSHSFVSYKKSVYTLSSFKKGIRQVSLFCSIDIGGRGAQGGDPGSRVSPYKLFMV